MKTFKLLFAVVALFLSQSATAQSDLTPEETAFLKSLNGKWSRSDAGGGMPCMIYRSCIIRTAL